jgi:hypothetical protein
VVHDRARLARDRQIAGIVASKQSWQLPRGDDGEVLVDRPDIQLYPPENVLLDPNADWTNPAQLGQFVGLRNFFAPTTPGQMVRRGAETARQIPWVPGLTKQDFDFDRAPGRRPERLGGDPRGARRQGRHAAAGDPQLWPLLPDRMVHARRWPRMGVLDARQGSS